ncbi:hypothetical protein RFI_21924, partial [Reticulomyxa filosa]
KKKKEQEQPSKLEVEARESEIKTKARTKTKAKANPDQRAKPKTKDKPKSKLMCKTNMDANEDHDSKSKIKKEKSKTQSDIEELQKQIGAEAKTQIEKQQKRLKEMEQEMEDKVTKVCAKIAENQKAVQQAFNQLLSEVQQQKSIQRQVLQVALKENQKWLDRAIQWENTFETQHWNATSDTEKAVTVEKAKQFYQDCLQYCHSKYAIPLKKISLEFFHFLALFVYIYKCIYNSAPIRQEMIGSVSGKLAVKPKVTVNIVKKMIEREDSPEIVKDEKKYADDSSATRERNNKHVDRSSEKVPVLRIAIEPSDLKTYQVHGYVVQIIQRDFEPKIAEIGADKNFVEIELVHKLTRWCGDIWVQNSFSLRPQGQQNIFLLILSKKFTFLPVQNNVGCLKFEIFPIFFICC